MSDDVIPLDEIGKIETVNVYNQAYVDKQQKRIAELEKENAELSKNIGNLKKTYRKQRNKRIDDLQKENAELKETLKTYNGCGDWDNDFHTCRVYLQHEELQDYIEQLTKAKKIIREFMKYEINEYDGSLEIHFEELKKQAEQFLKE